MGSQQVSIYSGQKLLKLLALDELTEPISPPAIIYTHYASDLDMLVLISHLHNDKPIRPP